MSTDMALLAIGIFWGAVLAYAFLRESRRPLDETDAYCARVDEELDAGVPFAWVSAGVEDWSWPALDREHRP